MQDIDAEEKEKQWYLVGLERINQQLIELLNTSDVNQLFYLARELAFPIFMLKSFNKIFHTFSVYCSPRYRPSRTARTGCRVSAGGDATEAR